MTAGTDSCRKWVDEQWATLDDEQRIAATAFVLRCVRDSIPSPGSFRRLIYDRIGLGPDSYCDVYLNGGMDVSNFVFEHGGKNEFKQHTDEDRAVDW